MLYHGFWIPILATMIASTWWSYAGRKLPYFIPVEVIIGALSALWWAIIASCTKCNNSLFIYGFVWDFAYVVVSIAVPKFMLNIDIKPMTMVWVVAAMVCMIMAKITTGES